jgi:hypothetical protein
MLWSPMEGVHVQIHCFKTSKLFRNYDLVSLPGCFTTDTYVVGGWVDKEPFWILWRRDIY